MIESILFYFFGVFIFSFIFWRRMKEDYPPEDVFATCLLLLLSVCTFQFFFRRYFSLWWFWLTLTGLLVVLAYVVKKYQLRFYETFESTVLGGLICLFLLYGYQGIKTANLVLIVASVFCFLSTFFFSYINSRYKNFGWYRSGKTGFAGLTTLGLFFLARGVVAIFFPFMLSFAGIYEPIASGAMAFLLFLAVFNLARQV